MKSPSKPLETRRRHGYYRETELLLLADGRIMAHNITPATARLLEALAPGAMAGRLQPGRDAAKSKTPKAK